MRRRLVLCLDGYLRGNQRSFSTVRVPSESEEQYRSTTRQRQSLIKARGHVMYYGGRLQGEWWQPRRWQCLAGELEPHLRDLRGALRSIIVVREEQIVRLERSLEGSVQVSLPQGHGAADLPANGTRIMRLEPPRDAQASGRLHGVVSERGHQRSTPLPRFDHPTRQPAIARQFAVDWWRIRTGRITPAQLGLTLKALPAMRA